MSLSAVVKVTDQNSDALEAKARRVYEAERCGICEKGGAAERFWFTQASRCAHTVCYGKIEHIEVDLITKINAVFKGEGDRVWAHVRAIRAVKKELGGVSIKTYLETEGADKLKSIFDSVGIAAALNPTAKL